jgi:hypothetical protein
MYSEATSMRRGTFPRAGAVRHEWVDVGSHCWGALFIQDDTGRVLVLPRAEGLRDMPHQETLPGAEEDKRRVESRLEEDEPVCVSGTVRALPELLTALRSGELVPPFPQETLNELLRLEREGKPLPCFFGADVEVAGMSYPVLFSKTMSTTRNLLLAGGGLVGAAVLFAAL